MLTLDALRTFTAVVEEASFTAAAGRLHATQSGVSQKVARLERQLGVRLLERGVHGATPTPAGRTLYARAVALLRDVTGLESEIGAFASGEAGAVTIGLMPALTRTLAGPSLRACLADNPNARITLVERNAVELIDEVAADRLDAAVVPAFDAPSSMRCRSLGRTAEVLLGRANGAHLQPVAPRELPPLRLVLQSAAHIRRRRVLAQLRAQGAQVEATLELDSMFATLEQVAHSDWLTVLPAVMLGPEIESGALDVRPLVATPLLLDLVLIEPARREPAPLVEAFGRRLEAGVDGFNAWFEDRVARARR